jgi:hypothetical protein
MTWIAVLHTGNLQNLLGIARLTHCDPITLLLDLNSHVGAESSQIAHLKELMHLQLELLNFLHACPGDYQVVDIDPKNEKLFVVLPPVQSMVKLAPSESKRTHGCVQFGIPGTWHLL